SGTYDISITTGSEELKAQWVVKGSSTRKAKNVVLFIGDGMATSMISAARYLSQKTKFGKFEKGDGFLSFEKFPGLGRISTNGIDSIITDSANSAATYNSGQKGYVNALNVYSDTTTNDSLDDTKVEILASIIRRKRPGMCIGVVTTASVVDATPAAVYSYTNKRGDEGIIADQMLNGFKYYTKSGKEWTTPADNLEKIMWNHSAVKADVLLGGGGVAFCKKATADSKCDSLKDQDQYAAFKAAGYQVFNDADSFNAYDGSDPIVGIFHMSHMNVWYDRNVDTANLATPGQSPLGDGKGAPKQPGLEEMTMKAIKTMEKKCKDGYFLMSEAASIDKMMHPIDFDRGLADLLELDRTVKAVVKHVEEKKDTQIYLTADHAQGFDVYGTVDLNYFRKASNDDSVDIRGASNANKKASDPIYKSEKRQAIGVYQDAGWPDMVIDENGLPTKFGSQTFKLASGKIDSPGHNEDFEHKSAPRSPSTNLNLVFQAAGMSDITRTVGIPNPKDVVATGGLVNLGTLPTGQGSTVHTLQSVDLYCYGPSGTYDISITTGSEELKAQWVVKGSSTRKAKNVVLFIGDGMATSMISAARYLSQKTKFGKFEKGDGFLSFEKFPGLGRISTNGIDSIITDSANSAATYNSGQKGYVNALNVYSDTTTNDSLDDTKVEILASIIRRKRPGMCIGVVTTASVVDATPAAVYSYTNKRGDEGIIADQMLNGFKYYTKSGKEWTTPADNLEKIMWNHSAVKADVLLGGGGVAFCKKATADSKCDSLKDQDQYAAFKAAGYQVFNDADSFNAYDGSDPIVGIFHMSHMNVWYDRNVDTANLATPGQSPLGDGKGAPKQPGLEEMTMKAIKTMEKKCKDGYFLMSEAASIDKMMHPIDFDRGLADLLELDRTVKAVVKHVEEKKDTQIYLTADHAQGFDVYGTVDLNYFRKASNDDSVDIRGASNANKKASDPIYKSEKRQAIGVYQDAGWPDMVIDENGLPTKFGSQTFKLASGKIDSPGHNEDFEHKSAPRSPSTNLNLVFQAAGMSDITRTVGIPNPKDVVATGGLVNLGSLPTGQGVTVHTLQSVDLYCYGPVAHKCSRVMDNTELFFLMADALGLGDVADEKPSNPDTGYCGYKPEEEPKKNDDSNGYPKKDDTNKNDDTTYPSKKDDSSYKPTSGVAPVPTTPSYEKKDDTYAVPSTKAPVPTKKGGDNIYQSGASALAMGPLALVAAVLAFFF
ncbi:hypothetical protein HDU97_003019, partial [Phlyctochytrium planicorne]